MGHEHVLNPWCPREAISTAEAARRARRSQATIQRWCVTNAIGRRVAGGHWRVSAVALEMFICGDEAAHSAYLRGERDGIVAQYYERFGILSFAA